MRKVYFQLIIVRIRLLRKEKYQKAKAVTYIYIEIQLGEILYDISRNTPSTCAQAYPCLVLLPTHTRIMHTKSHIILRAVFIHSSNDERNRLNPEVIKQTPSQGVCIFSCNASTSYTPSATPSTFSLKKK